MKIALAIARVHKLEYALGDIHDDNILIADRDGTPCPVFFDCNPGSADKPNIDFAQDVKEFRMLVEGLFPRGDRRKRQIVQQIENAVRSKKPRAAFEQIAQNLST